MRDQSFVRWLCNAAGSLLLAVPLLGQCATAVVAEGSFADADNTVSALCAWDPDLSGPAPAVVVCGGFFRMFGNVPAAGLAAYDPATRVCTPLVADLQIPPGPAIAGVRAIAVAANNDLIVGGQFSGIAGVGAANIARWNGVAWQPLGAGLPSAPQALLALPNGDILAGVSVGSSPSSVLRWDGAAWSPLGSIGGFVAALVRRPNGEVVAGGTSLLPGGLHLARWDGANWSAFPTSPDAGVLGLDVAQNGDLLVAGGFLSVGGAPVAGVARFDGTAWQALGGGMFNPVHCIEELANGDIVAGGLFVAADGVLGLGGTPATQVARWNGAQWSAMGAGLASLTPNVGQPVLALLGLPGGGVLAGGTFQPEGGVGGQNRIARWDGTRWSSIRPGTGGAVAATVATPGGLRYAVGSFTVLEGVAANRVAVRGSGGWQPLGSGANGPVQAVLPLPNGDVVIGGDFTEAGGVACSRVARWDGAAWWPLGAGLPATVRSLALDAQGRLLAAGAFLDQIAVWDGQAWNGTGVAVSFLGVGGGGLVRAAGDGGVLGVYANASLFQRTIGRWNGSGWTPVVGTTSNLVAELANGDLVAAIGTSVRRWNGATWTTLAGLVGSPQALVVLPNDEVLVAAAVTGTPATSRLQRWNGVAWATLGVTEGGSVADLRWLVDGSLSVCGSFRRLLGVETAWFARLATNCPAAVAAAGAGCAGTGGSNTLNATSAPWAGSTFRSRAAGLAPGSLAIEVLGLSALAQPLAAALPQAGSGCTLWVVPDVLRAYVVAGSELDLAVAIPDDPAWIGVALRQQVVPIEVDGTGAIQTVSATPALVLTVGRF